LSCPNACHVTEQSPRAKTQQNVIAQTAEKYSYGVAQNVGSSEETTDAQNADSLDRNLHSLVFIFSSKYLVLAMFTKQHHVLRCGANVFKSTLEDSHFCVA
jgi:hypothetical protein